jgi:hypothetical protein
MTNLFLRPNKRKFSSKNNKKRLFLKPKNDLKQIEKVKKSKK